MSTYYFFFYFLLLLQVQENFASEISLQKNDEQWMECLFKDQRTISVEKDNLILEKLIFADRGCSTCFGAFPIAATFAEWILLNKCLESDTKKLSCDQIIGAMKVADGLPLISNNKNKNAIISLLIEKAKKMLTFEDFKNFDEEEINQIQELRELKDYILYPHQLMHDIYTKQEVFKIPSSEWCCDNRSEGGGGYHYIKKKEKDPLANRNVIICDTIAWCVFSILTYIQPWSNLFLIVCIHAYIFKKNIQKWRSWYGYAQAIKNPKFSVFSEYDKKYYFKYKINEENKLYYCIKDETKQELFKIAKDYLDNCENLSVLSMDNKYISCFNSVYDIKNQNIIEIQKDYIVAAYLAHDTYLLIKTDRFRNNLSEYPNNHQVLCLSKFMSLFCELRVCEIGIGKKADNKIELIYSIKKYTESTGFPNDIVLSVDRTKLLVYLLDWDDIVQIFSLPNPNNLSCDDLFIADNTMIKKIKPLKEMFFYVALVLFLYNSGYFFLRNKIILEKYQKWCEIEDWHKLISTSMRLFKNKFSPPIKRFLRRKHVRVARANRYSSAWEKIS